MCHGWVQSDIFYVGLTEVCILYTVSCFYKKYSNHSHSFFVNCFPTIVPCTFTTTISGYTCLFIYCAHLLPVLKFFLLLSENESILEDICISLIQHSRVTIHTSSAKRGGSYHPLTFQNMIESLRKYRDDLFLYIYRIIYEHSVV
jgi:hypothetical protein